MPPLLSGFSPRKAKDPRAGIPGIRALGLVLALTGIVALSVPEAHAQPATSLHLEGRLTTVRFHDGDTFGILSGPQAGRSARLVGLNSLESYGPVHRWIGMPAPRLLELARAATVAASAGQWHCRLEPGREDVYGRLLVDCPDLLFAQLRAGLAHAFGIDGPAPPEPLAAQREAILARRGLWSAGAPALLLTSVHSARERLRNGGYDRVVSTTDGSAFRWRHRHRYRTCQRVCLPLRSLTDASRAQVIGALTSDPLLSGAISALGAPVLQACLDEVATTGRVPQLLDGPAQTRFARALAELRRDPAYWRTVPGQGSCMLYVPPPLRYRDPPTCLVGTTARGRDDA